MEWSLKTRKITIRPCPIYLICCIFNKKIYKKQLKFPVFLNQEGLMASNNRIKILGVWGMEFRLMPTTDSERSQPTHSGRFRLPPLMFHGWHRRWLSFFFNPLQFASNFEWEPWTVIQFCYFLYSLITNCLRWAGIIFFELFYWQQAEGNFGHVHGIIGWSFPVVSILHPRLFVFHALRLCLSSAGPN